MSSQDNRQLSQPATGTDHIRGHRRTHPPRSGMSAATAGIAPSVDDASIPVITHPRTSSCAHAFAVPLTNTPLFEAQRLLSEALERIKDAVAAIRQGEDSPSASSMKRTFLDFSLNRITRPGHKPIPLHLAVWVAMLEHFSRRPVLTERRFLLLPRYRRRALCGDARPPAHALRHEASELRSKLADFF